MKLALTTGAGVAGTVTAGVVFTDLGMEATMAGVAIGAGIIPGASTTGAGVVMAGAHPIGTAVTMVTEDMADITMEDIMVMATTTLV